MARKSISNQKIEDVDKENGEIKNRPSVSSHDEKGWEVPDSRPMEIPLGWKRPPTLTERIRQMVRIQLSNEAGAEGQETFQEADDFDIGEDYDPRTPYELDEEVLSNPYIDPSKVVKDAKDIRKDNSGANQDADVRSDTSSGRGSRNASKRPKNAPQEAKEDQEEQAFSEEVIKRFSK